jgi:LysR family hydrogen peroxide-inducible transcriptional activator
MKPDQRFGGLTLIPEMYYQTLPYTRKQKVSFFQAPVPVREVSLVYYRPFAKLRIITALVNMIRPILNENLISNRYQKHQLEIARF